MDLSNFYSDSVSTPPWLHFRISSFIGVGHSILNCCVTFFLFLEKLNIFLYLGLLCGFYFLKNLLKYHFLAASDRLIKKVLWTENIHSEQDWNLSWMDLSNFYSDSVSTQPWLHFRMANFISVGHWILNCCVTFFPFLENLNNFLYFGFSQCLTLCWIKVSEKCRSQQDSNLRRKTPSDF